MKVQAVKCPNCGDLIYSRATHDFHFCSCKKVFVDGGFEYFRCGFSPNKEPEVITIEVAATKQQLYQDWRDWTDKYGLIEGDGR